MAKSRSFRNGSDFRCADTQLAVADTHRDGGSRATFHFCPDCASIVHYEIEQLPGVVAVPVGAFADPGFPPPRFSVYESRRHAWVQMPESVEHLD